VSGLEEDAASDVTPSLSLLLLPLPLLLSSEEYILIFRFT
jgi:hypothetical protein